MIIHPHIPKRKKRKPNAKTRALHASWQDILDKYETKTQTPVMVVKRTDSNFVPRPGSDVRHIPSLDTSIGVALKPAPKVYTGTECMGIVVQHKSCLQPVFNKQSAEDSAKMRR